MKKIYKTIPLKRHLYSVLRSITQVPEPIFRHLHFEGPFNVKFMNYQFKIYSTGTVIENTIFWEGFGNSWEKVSLDLWSQLCEGADVILDIGANTGVYSTLAAAVNPSSKIIAFEPNQDFSRGIYQSARINQFDIQVEELALSDTKGSLLFTGYEVKRIDESSISNNLKTIQANTLKDIIQDNDLKKIDIIKIDVERHEPEVLRGMGEDFALFKPDLIIEVLDSSIAEQLWSFFSELDYLYFSIDDKNGLIRPMLRLEKSDDRNVLVCKPKTAEMLDIVKYRKV